MASCTGEWGGGSGGSGGSGSEWVFLGSEVISGTWRNRGCASSAQSGDRKARSNGKGKARKSSTLFFSVVAL